MSIINNAMQYMIKIYYKSLYSDKYQDRNIDLEHIELNQQQLIQIVLYILKY